ncbi:MAG: ATP-binding cassette domain-containing protein, partial [Rhodocyclaceae bacterium]|nr:ATP-binding cassette domain-containing protein [Rhodocyclaceae bacterium]
YVKQQDKIAHLQKFIARFKAKASKAKQAQSRVKALERMDKLAPILASADFTFEFKEPANLPNPMLSMVDASFGYPPPEDAPAGTPPTVIVRNVNKSVQAGQRIGILGANGRGKSTLVKTIARDLAPISGTVTEGKGLKIGYFAQQELDVLQPASNPLEHMVRMARAGLPPGQSGREQDLRTFLGTFNFAGDMVKQPVGTMSGGEKARLVLCMIVWQRPNLLLLDEPTNHLDLATREALAMALNEFEGTVMLVSHDRSLLRSVCDEFWLVSRGGIEPFDGDLDDYQRYLLDEARRSREELKASLKEAPAAAAQPVPAPVVQAPPTPAKKLNPEKLKGLKRDLGKLEQTILDLQTKRHGLAAQLSTTQDVAKIAELGLALQKVDEELAALEDRWLILSEQIEVAEH